MKTLAFFLTLAILSVNLGCSTTYYKDGADKQDFLQAKSDCQYRAYGVPPLARSSFIEDCMGGHGWFPK
jgi:hypothetical protein